MGLSLVTLGAVAALSSGACSSDDSGGGTGGSSGGGTGGFGATGAVSGTGGTGATGTGATSGSGGTGGGTSDPCAADENSADTTVACNGPAIGAQADNAYGGKCTPDGSEGQGSCTDATNICDSFEVALGGICVVECTPGGTYVSTGGCPKGSRCFDFSGVAFCYPDCGDETGCGTGVCDGDGACSSPFPPDTDGGVSDAATD